MHNIQFIRDAANWFTTIKAPDLKDKVLGGLHDIENGVALESNYKKLFGFILFDYSIHKGPSYFIDSEEAAKEIGVTEEFKYYANDWINYSKKTKQL
jgi:hypothetical protein